MTTLHITIGIALPVITFLIGRYFRGSKIQELNTRVYRQNQYIVKQENTIGQLNETIETLDESERQALRFQFRTAVMLEKIVQIVPNKDPHHAADKEYIAVYPNNGIEPAHFTHEEYYKGVDRLKDHPEDKAN